MPRTEVMVGVRIFPVRFGDGAEWDANMGSGPDRMCLLRASHVRQRRSAIKSSL